VKIAITADLHLTSREEHPERYRALENIFEQIEGESIQHLVVAGDLFNVDLQDFGDFDALCREHKAVKVHVIPGNHDSRLREASLLSENVTVYEEPGWASLDRGGPQVLMIPYLPRTTMGEAIESCAEDLPDGGWVLVGHGDWSEGMHVRNPLEPGVYMPLTSQDVVRYRPQRVFLGHIHVPYRRGLVQYPGSPYPLDITETGKRQFIVYEPTTDVVETRLVDTEVIYFDETFVTVPIEGEHKYLERQIRDRIEAWHLDEKDYSKARVRVRVRGYCTDRRGLGEVAQRAFKGLTFYEDAGPDLSELQVSDDLDLQTISGKVLARIEALEWGGGGDEPGKADIVLAALQMIYGGQ
jgi:exonuclease SbcD